MLGKIDIDEYLFDGLEENSSRQENSKKKDKSALSAIRSPLGFE